MCPHPSKTGNFLNQRRHAAALLGTFEILMTSLTVHSLTFHATTKRVTEDNRERERERERESESEREKSESGLERKCVREITGREYIVAVEAFSLLFRSRNSRASTYIHFTR